VGDFSEAVRGRCYGHWRHWPFLLKTNYEKNLIITLVFEKNAIFSAENFRESQKIVIIASTPGTDVMIFEIFSPKNLAKIWAFLTQNRGT
jgi:hypothetical protein